MQAYITNKVANHILNHALRNRKWTPPDDVWLGLHDANPTVLNDVSTEIQGGGYGRREIRFYEADLRTVLNRNAIVFEDLPACTIHYLAVWAGVAGSYIMFYIPLGTPVTEEEGGTFKVEVADIAIVLGTDS